MVDAKEWSWRADSDSCSSPAEYPEEPANGIELPGDDTDESDEESPSTTDKAVEWRTGTVKSFARINSNKHHAND